MSLLILQVFFTSPALIDPLEEINFLLPPANRGCLEDNKYLLPGKKLQGKKCLMCDITADFNAVDGHCGAYFAPPALQ